MPMFSLTATFVAPSLGVVLVTEGGVSGIVHPAASFPVVVKQQGGNMIEVNIEQTPLTHLANVHVSGKAGEILPVIDTILSEANLFIAS